MVIIGLAIGNCRLFGDPTLGIAATVPAVRARDPLGDRVAPPHITTRGTHPLCPSSTGSSAPERVDC
jgi:hypothetical protein